MSNQPDDKQPSKNIIKKILKWLGVVASVVIIGFWYKNCQREESLKIEKEKPATVKKTDSITSPIFTKILKTDALPPDSLSSDLTERNNLPFLTIPVKQVKQKLFSVQKTKKPKITQKTPYKPTQEDKKIDGSIYRDSPYFKAKDQNIQDTVKRKQDHDQPFYDKFLGQSRVDTITIIKKPQKRIINLKPKNDIMKILLH
ncbi:MAG: hypothetical protein ACK4J0_03380 [Candidatus Anstonellaceae archaeon]